MGSGQRSKVTDSPPTHQEGLDFHPQDLKLHQAQLPTAVFLRSEFRSGSEPDGNHGTPPPQTGFLFNNEESNSFTIRALVFYSEGYVQHVDHVAARLQTEAAGLNVRTCGKQTEGAAKPSVVTVGSMTPPPPKL